MSVVYRVRQVLEELYRSLHSHHGPPGPKCRSEHGFLPMTPKLANCTVSCIPCALAYASLGEGERGEREKEREREYLDSTCNQSDRLSTIQCKSRPSTQVKPEKRKKKC